MVSHGSVVAEKGYSSPPSKALKLSRLPCTNMELIKMGLGVRVGHKRPQLTFVVVTIS